MTRNCNRDVDVGCKVIQEHLGVVEVAVIPAQRIRRGLLTIHDLAYSLEGCADLAKNAMLGLWRVRDPVTANFYPFADKAGDGCIGCTEHGAAGLYPGSHAERMRLAHEWVQVFS